MNDDAFRMCFIIALVAFGITIVMVAPVLLAVGVDRLIAMLYAIAVGTAAGAITLVVLLERMTK